ncbi:helicase HerA domain-containing protein [Streptomyces sp. NPDC017056]|uniref:helicase HerA domain-containing protein n=1 Tax=Streptomyces sp. NPDC017056 TaxID=3364973 RepID=UPI0037887FD4
MWELVAKAKESAPVIGVGSGGRAVCVDLDAESPHILVNASTGGGKSVTLRCIACQMLHHGSLVVVLDTKRISHPWASELPRVAYCHNIADIHNQLIALGMEGRRRTRLADDLGIDADPKAIGPRLLILLEEVNATMKQLARYWDKTRETGDPKVPPAVDALNETLYMGRQLRMHVLLVAQSATARALGGPEAREQFSTRILARYSVNAWRMLAPEAHPAPKSTKHPGRAQVVSGGSARETQFLFFTEAEVREWAATGKKTVAAGGPAPVQLHKPPAEALFAPTMRADGRRRGYRLRQGPRSVEVGFVAAGRAVARVVGWLRDGAGAVAALALHGGLGAVGGPYSDLPVLARTAPGHGVRRALVLPSVLAEKLECHVDHAAVAAVLAQQMRVLRVHPAHGGLLVVRCGQCAFSVLRGLAVTTWRVCKKMAEWGMILGRFSGLYAWVFA